MMTASAVAETEYFIADEKEEVVLLPPRRRALRPKAKVTTQIYACCDYIFINTIAQTRIQ